MEFFLIICILITFLFCAFLNLHLPGLGRDEVIEPYVAIKYLIKNDFSLFKYVYNFSFSDFMVDPYHSFILVFLYIFVFYFFGASVYAVRLVNIFAGLIFLLFFYFFIRSFFGRRIAVFSLILISTLPDLIFYIRTTIDFHFPLFLIFGCLLFFWEFYKRKRLFNLYMGSLFLGIGFSFNPIFWWFIFAFVIAFFCIERQFHFKRKEVVIGFLFFLLGALPIALWNLSLPFEHNTISYLLKKTQGFEIGPFDKEDNFRFIEESERIQNKDSLGVKAHLRFSQAISILKGGDISIGKGFIFPLNLWFFLIAFIFLLIAVSFGVIKKKKKILFFLTLILIIFLESTILSYPGCSRYQMLLLVPFCLVLSAIFLNYLYNHSKVLVYLLLGLIVASNLLILVGTYNNFILGLYHNSILGYQGLNAPFDFPSDNIYRLAEYLQKNQINQPILLNEKGLDPTFNLYFLTSLKVKPPINLIKKVKENRSIFAEELKKELVSGNKIVIRNAGMHSEIVTFTQDIIKDLNETMITNKTFYKKNGEIEYLLLQI